MFNEIEVYGMSVEKIEKTLMNGVTADISGHEMVVAGLLSDAQEMLYMEGMTDNTNKARQLLNVAKYILFEMEYNRKKAEMV